MINRNNILILGNGADINELDFNKIDDEFITAGVNRIYFKYMPEYYFIYDLIDIMPDFPKKEYEIYTHTSKLSQYLRENVNNKTIFTAFPFPEYIHNHSAVNMLIRAMNDYVYEGEDNYFYICGCPLLESKGHFYDESINTTSQKTLDGIYEDFVKLKRKGYKLISCMEASKLNDLFPMENKEILYNYKEVSYV